MITNLFTFHPNSAQSIFPFFFLLFSNNCNLFMLLNFFGCMHNKVFCFINKFLFLASVSSRVFSVLPTHESSCSCFLLLPLKKFFAQKEFFVVAFLCLEFFLLFVFILWLLTFAFVSHFCFLLLSEIIGEYAE